MADVETEDSFDLLGTKTKGVWIGHVAGTSIKTKSRSATSTKIPACSATARDTEAQAGLVAGRAAGLPDTGLLDHGRRGYDGDNASRE